MNAKLLFILKMLYIFVSNILKLISFDLATFAMLKKTSSSFNETKIKHDFMPNTYCGF